MSSSRRRPRNERRRKSAGFTLVELMVSLIMGLIVALAAVGLAKTATNTFFEQARISAAEAAVRTASERLRSDLSRVSFMATPNVQLDPKVARTPATIGAAYRVTALANLQGLAIEPAASNIRTHALTTANTLTPQEVYIAGNLTSDDVYRGMFIADATGCGGTGGVRIRLDGRADPAVRRMFNGETDQTKRKEMTELVFMPGLRMTPAVTGKSYAVQVMDMRGCYQYLTICAVTADSQSDAVDLDLAGDSARGILSPSDLGGDVCGGNLMEEVAVAPIQRVRWYLGPETVAARTDTDDALDGPLATTRKFNLYRQLLAADGDPTAAKVVGPPEVIAEYGVDMKFGLFIESGTSTATTTNIDMEGQDTDVATWVSRSGTYSAGNVGPQRVRSVRYRLAFRAPFADRKENLTMASPPPYLARYNMGASLGYARVRTVMSEVALMNQAKALW